MSYYQGDFYQGDPGFFGSLGRVFKGLAGTAAGFIPGAGGVVSRAITKIPTGAITRGKAIIKAGGAIIAKHPVLSAAGAAGAIGIGAGALGRGMMHPGMGGMRGFHISKKTGREVRNRRMNVCNPRALHRAIRRASGFARLAKKVLRFTSPRMPKGRAHFKFRRRKK